MNLNPIVILILIVLIGAVVFGVLLSGVVNPSEAARAKGIELQNPIDAAHSQFVLEQDEIIQQAKTQDQINQMKEDERYAQALHNQDLAQQQRSFEEQEALKDWGIRAGTIGLAAALVILALGITIRLTLAGWHAFVNAQTTRQTNARATIVDQMVQQLQAAAQALEAEHQRTQERLAQFDSQTALNEQREAIQLKGLGQLHTRVDALEDEAEQIAQLLGRVVAQLSETQLRIAELQTRGDGNDARDHSSANDKILRLKTAS